MVLLNYCILFIQRREQDGGLGGLLINKFWPWCYYILVHTLIAGSYDKIKETCCNTSEGFTEHFCNADYIQWSWYVSCMLGLWNSLNYFVCNQFSLFLLHLMSTWYYCLHFSQLPNLCFEPISMNELLLSIVVYVKHDNLCYLPSWYTSFTFSLTFQRISICCLTFSLLLCAYIM